MLLTTAVLLFSFLMHLLPPFQFVRLSIQFNESAESPAGEFLDWHEQAIWWNRDWRYRLPVDVTAPVILYDKIVTVPVDWATVFAQLHIEEADLDPDSLRLVEYTPGGHITRRHTGDVNRFDTLPVTLNRDRTGVEFLMAGRTAMGETRRFFLYFDTTDNPKPPKAYHYLAQAETPEAIAGYRTGPDLENVYSPRTGIDLYTKPGGVFNLIRASFKTGDDFSLYYPHYWIADDQAPRGFARAVYTTTLTPLSLEAQVAFSGYEGNLGPETTGKGSFRISHLFIDRKSYAVLEGSVEMRVHQPLHVDHGELVLAMIHSGLATGAWYTNVDGQVVPYDLGQTFPLCACSGTLVMKHTQYLTQLFQLNDLEHSVLAHAGGLQTLYDAKQQQVLLDSPDGWQPGDWLTYRFTYLVAPERLTYEEIRPLVNSLNAALDVVLGTPTAYSDALFHAQLRHFEAQAWAYVIDNLSQNGWGEPWNIVYMIDVETGERQPAHHQDSSMGAGFILHAAALKVAMTGDPIYYEVADRYANYFLQLERTDVAQHGPDVAGRISYFYNGSSNRTWLNTPPGTVHNQTSMDQVITAAMGLWSYYHLDHAKIRHEDEVETLLLRMGNYVDENPDLVNALHNIEVLLGAEENWLLTDQQNDPQKHTYRMWFIENTPQQLVTGIASNTFFIDGMLDRLRPSKDGVQLKNRYSGALDNLATGGKGYYPLERGRSYPEAWGYIWDEFIRGQFIQRSSAKILAYDPTQEPSHYLDLHGHGGARDSIDGRGSTEDAAMAMWAALHEPEGKITVAGEPRVRYIDFALDAIHAAVAFLMHDNGGLRESYPGTLGNYSAVCETCLTSDFSGYFLTLMAYYNLFYKNVDNPMPMDRWDYIQGVAEWEGTTTIKYLGDGSITQKMVFPRADQAIIAAGVFSRPTLTFAADGTISQLADRTLDFAVDLSYGQIIAGTVAQVPLQVEPREVPVDVIVHTWNGVEKAWSIASQRPEDSIRFTVGGLMPGFHYLVQVDGETWAGHWPNGQGEISFTLNGNNTAQQITVLLDTALLKSVFLPAILIGH